MDSFGFFFIGCGWTEVVKENFYIIHVISDFTQWTKHPVFNCFSQKFSTSKINLWVHHERNTIALEIGIFNVSCVCVRARNGMCMSNSGTIARSVNVSDRWSHFQCHSDTGIFTPLSSYFEWAKIFPSKQEVFIDRSLSFNYFFGLFWILDSFLLNY